MSRSLPVQRILVKAEKKERTYDWLGAAELYDEASSSYLKQKNYLKAGEIQERIGICFHRAAMQSKNRSEFKKIMQNAVTACERAQSFHEEVSDGPKEARKQRCNALAKYFDHWIASDADRRRKLLDDCLESQNKALSGFAESGNMLEYRKAYAELPLVFFFRIFLEWDRPTLQRILWKGMEWGEKATTGLSGSDNPQWIASAYLALATCLSDSGFYLISESEDIDSCRLRAKEFLGKAVELASEADDAFLSGLAHLWLGINSGEEEAVKHHEKALEQGKKARDNFIIASALDYLAYDNYWKARAHEDPERRIELAEKAMQFYDDADRLFSMMSFVSPRGGLVGPSSGRSEHYYYLAMWEPNPRKKMDCLEESEKLGVGALVSAEESGMPVVVAQVLHVVSKTLQAQARLLQDPSSKKDRLGRALKHRERTIEIQKQLTPFFYWNLGVMLNYLSDIKSDLSEIATDPKSKSTLLEQAIQSKKECLRLCNKVMPAFERKGEIALFAGLRDYQDTYAALLIRLYQIRNKPEYLRSAVEILTEAVKSASKLGNFSLMAESQWKAATIQGTRGEHLEASRNFERASESYFKAAQKIPPLKKFYQDQSSYMQAWGEIERAKHYHAQGLYGQAKKHYKEAASLHASTERWNYLSPNYSALAQLEEAESLSRAERTQQAMKLFQRAAVLFGEAKSSILIASDEIKNTDERDLARRLTKALDVREEYCFGRIALEEAKLLDRQGEKAAASRKYGLASKRFQEVLEKIEHEPSFADATVAKDRNELTPIIYLCKAWQMMTKADAEASPKLYLEASRLFDEVKEHSLNEKSKLLAMGHSRFCKALEAGARFEDSRDTTQYAEATRHLKSAADYYVRADFRTASEYAVATQRLFDGYIYMDNAMKETDPEKRAKNYLVAERVLQASVESYKKAKHSGKSREVQRLLEKVKEERKLALSLSKVLNAPSITSSTTSFATPTPSEESAVGLEMFERANIQANLIVPTKEVPVGKEFSLDIHTANIGKQTVMLDKISGVLIPAFDLVAKPSYCIPENTHLNMRGKRLGPLKIEETNLAFRSHDVGVFKIEPAIAYANEAGDQNVLELEPVTIKITKIVLPDRITTGHEGLDNLLLGGLPETYAVILTSPAGDERNLLIKRFLEAGTKENQTVFYVTTRPIQIEDTAKKQKSNLHVFLCNPDADRTIAGLPNTYQLKGVENLTDIGIALTQALQKLGTSAKSPRRCCIEIVSDVLLQHQALKTRKLLTRLIPELKSKGFTILAVMDPEMHSSQETRAVLDLFDGEISISRKKNVGFIRVERMNRREYLESDLPIDRE